MLLIIHLCTIILSYKRIAHRSDDQKHHVLILIEGVSNNDVVSK